MQCPGCGFENIPGRQDCAICSKPLVATANRESVMPPRAKDSSFIERIRWRWSKFRPNESRDK